MGIARDMIDAGIWIDRARSIVNGKSTDLTVDLSDLPFAMLGLPQNDTERLLTRHLSRFGIEIERGMSREDLTQADGRVRTVLFGGAGGREEASFRYVVGCDGAHSAVRRALGIAFEGSAIPAELMLADVHIDWSVPRGRKHCWTVTKPSAARSARKSSLVPHDRSRARNWNPRVDLPTPRFSFRTGAAPGLRTR
jgi:2-polyprenyl-6-methoxyphenol hydroxylase-like FAD-dependent oxidoreductase